MKTIHFATSNIIPRKTNYDNIFKWKIKTLSVDSCSGGAKGFYEIIVKGKGYCALNTRGEIS